MDLLEYFHDHPPQIEKFVDRKVTLPLSGNINLHGARGCGKSALIAHYLTVSPYKTLYIDLEDPALILNTLDTLPLQAYIDEFGIDELIFDHYVPGMLERFPRVKRTVVVSRVPLEEKAFVSVPLYPLDFEEFLAFNHGQTSVHAFNRFFKQGTLPALAIAYKPIRNIWKSFFQHQFTPSEQSLLLILARHNTQTLTVHQLYTFAKEHFKISKDFVYETMQRFQKEGIVYFIDNALRSSGKKMIFYDFAFAKYLAHDQNFNVQFDAMVALTLIKHCIDFRTLGIHGYLTEERTLIVPAPFESEEQFWLKAHQKFSLFKQHRIRHIQIVTVANDYRFDIESIRFEATPFHEWSIAHTETDTP